MASTDIYKSNTYDIIDAHAHIYPAKIAKKAVKAIGNFYDLPMDLDEGTADVLIENGKKCGVKNYIVHSVATTPNQTISINDFIKSEMDKHPELIGFAALHPDCEDFDMEFEHIEKLGLKGIKLHPDFQRFNIDDPKAYEIYKRAEGKYPILMHMGDARYEFSRPFRLRNIIEKFPDLTVIAAHFGGYQRWDEARECLVDTNVYLDTCSSLGFISKEYATERIHEYGADRILFATDFPMWRTELELDRFLRLDLTEDERKDILYNNAAKLLKLI